jgi:hypothetical protein
MGALPNEALNLSRRFAPRSLTPVRYADLELIRMKLLQNYFNALHCLQ